MPSANRCSAFQNGSGGARNSDTYALFAPTPGSDNGVSVGTEPDIAVSPTAIDFGQITLGANAATTVTIHNNGSADLTVSAISDPGGAFVITNLPTLTAIISPGNTATFEVTFFTRSDWRNCSEHQHFQR
ncbi:MAG: choice-of-anchor D domain-containing protein [Calditrichia bacterium]